MRVTYECSVDDVAEASLQRYRSVRAIRRTELGFGAATALLLGAATGSRVGGVEGAVAALASALLAFLVYRRAALWLQRRLIRRTWRQQLGGERVEVAVALEPHGLRIRYGTLEARTPWAQVRPPTEAAGGVQLLDVDGPLLRVPARAFADAHEAEAFRAAVADAANQG